jgi:glycosyltransferase involved in cell wall biosynthesis/O-antigen ligase
MNTTTGITIGPSTPQTVTEDLTRVAYVVHTFDMGGVERCVARLANHLDRERFAPVIICLNRSGDAANWLKVDDVPILELGKRPGNDWRVVRRLAKVLKQERIDVVHSHNWGTLLETVLARKLARTPFHVHAEHGLELSDLESHRWRRRLRTRATRYALRRVDEVVTIAHWIRRRLADTCGLDQQRVTVVPNGVEPSAVENRPETRSSLRNSLRIPETAVVVGSVGRLAGVKNLTLAVDAIGKLVQDGHDLHLILVGDGPEHGRLARCSEQLSLESRVHLVGQRDDAERWLVAMDVYINSSISEGMSLSLLEAMAAGLPAVVTDVGENRTLVGGTDPCGIVVPSEDLPAFSEAVERLSCRRELRSEFAASAVRRHTSSYCVSNMVGRYESLYECLAAPNIDLRTMSLTAVVWLACFIVLAVLALVVRSSWGVALYLLSFYLMPTFWWWGKGMLESLGVRWSLTAALILAVAVIVDRRPFPFPAKRLDRRPLLLLLLYAVNATLVHFLFADNPERSLNGLDLLWKDFGLLLLICASIRDKFDFRILLYSVIVGSAYIGYEAVINDRGNFSGARLEGIGAPGAAEANYLAGLMAFAIPLAGYLLFFGKRWEKLLAFASLPLIFDVILRCNSRGCFIAILVGGVWLLVSAKGPVRRYAVRGIILGGLAAFLMIGDEDIKDRFFSTFSPVEERDTSAQSRVDYSIAGLRMISDHPLGSGAEAAFKSDLGSRYLYGNESGRRAVHNGYIDIAAGWGIQGFLLYAGCIGLSWLILRRSLRNPLLQLNQDVAFLGVCIQTTLVIQLVSALFISSFDGEWFFWWIAMALVFDRTFGGASESTNNRQVSHHNVRMTEQAEASMGHGIKSGTSGFSA